MKRKSSFLLSVLLTLVMVFTLIVPVTTAESEYTSGNGVEPVTVSGNPQCDSASHKKIDPPENGSFDIVIGETTYTLSYELCPEKKYLSWSVSPEAAIITRVIVKGGPAANIYNYTAGASSDTGLVSPRNRGGNIPKISHFCFTWEEAPPSVLKGSISGHKYEENEGTPGAGWQIYLYENALAEGQNPGEEIEDNPFLSITTDEDGSFSFTDLAFGAYYLYEENREGWEQAVVAGPCIYLDGNSSGNNFVNKVIVDEEEAKGSIRVIKYLKECGPLQPQVQLFNGNSGCEDNPCISIEKTGPKSAKAGAAVTYKFTVENCGNIDLYDVVVTDALFGEEWKKEIGELDAESAPYVFTRNYTIPSGYKKEKLTNTAVVNGQYTCGYNGWHPFPETTNQTGCDCFCPGPSCPDESGTPMGGVTFNLYEAGDESGEIVATGITDDNGEILFTDLAPGNYRLEENVDGGKYHTFYSPSQDNIIVSENEETTVCVYNSPLPKCPVEALDSHTITIKPGDNGGGDDNGGDDNNGDDNGGNDNGGDDNGGNDNGNGDDNGSGEGGGDYIPPQPPEVKPEAPAAPKPPVEEPQEMVIAPEPPGQQPELPKTGSSALLLMGLGGLLSGIGVCLKRRKR